MTEPTSPSVFEGLVALRAGRRSDAVSIFDRLAAADPTHRLSTGLSRYLRRTDRAATGGVYTSPAAFDAFINGGGNIDLYASTVDALVEEREARPARSLIDIGAGDGRVLASLLARLEDHPRSVTVVEPSGPLADASAVALAPFDVELRIERSPVEDLALTGDHWWDAAHATFALHAIEPGTRREVLRRLRSTVSSIAIVEFDVPRFEDRSDEHLAYLASRYERGLAEYDGELVADGFLLPVLVGQIDPSAPRATWEQPASAWRRQLEGAGFEAVDLRPVGDYWWAPAVLITGS